MAQSTNLGYPRIGKNRELKRVGSGPNGGTLGRYANQLPVIVEQMAESFAAVTGIDLMQMARDKTGSSRDDDGEDRVVINPSESDR